MDSSDSSWQILFQPWFVKKLPMSMRPPRVLARSFPLIPAISTVHDSVQLLGFDLYSSLTLIHSLYGFCSSGQSFAASFLQIPRRQGHPCLCLYPSHCRADSGLSPVRTCARRAHCKNGGPLRDLRGFVWSFAGQTESCLTCRLPSSARQPVRSSRTDR